jgi:prephenate dehydrogenase
MRNSSSAAALSHQLGVRVADDKELLAADVVFVATPPAALDDVAAALKGYAGIIVSASASRAWMPAILTLHATSRTSACSWDSLPTDQASETALRCALM